MENEEYSYCVLFPAKKTSYGEAETVADGVLEAEVDAPFDTIFDQNMPGYQVLSFCVYEVTTLLIKITPPRESGYL